MFCLFILFILQLDVNTNKLASILDDGFRLTMYSSLHYSCGYLIEFFTEL